MARSRLKDVEDLLRNQQVGVRRKAIRNRGSARDTDKEQMSGTCGEQTAGGATRDKNAHLSRLSDGYQTATAYKPWPRAVAGEARH